jgi:hypothetical protein
MDRVKDVIWTGFKNTGIAMTFGAYHLYVMDEKWKLQQEIHRLQDEKTKAMLEEMKELSKRKWW